MATPGRPGNPFSWGNLPVHIIYHFNLITFYMIGVVIRQLLPHLSGVLQLHVNRPLERNLSLFRAIEISGKHLLPQVILL